MIIKAVTLFLIFMAVMAMFGKAHLLLPKRARRLVAKKCRSCGAPVPGRGPCPCERKG